MSSASMAMDANGMGQMLMAAHDMPQPVMPSAEVTAQTAAHPQSKNPANSDSSNCKQHDCCCSALSPSLLAPQATLSWIPEHVIDEATPRIVETVQHSEGQLLLPFANGPPKTVQL